LREVERERAIGREKGLEEDLERESLDWSFGVKVRLRF